MMMGREISAFTAHGGALDAARRAFPNATQPWLDLSTGINPQAYPIGDIPAGAWQRLPEETGLGALEAVAGRRYGVPIGCEVVAGPGTQALIQRLPVLCRGPDVRVLGPTFGEFERVFRDFGRQVRVVPRLEALSGADVAVAVNPNNPDGRLASVQDLVALAARVGWLVIDEAFIDILPAIHSTIPTLATAGGGARVIVLRSLGKTYGLAGVRLGFAILRADPAEQLRRLLGPWPVSGPALAIGRQALEDDAWLAETRYRLAEAARRLMFLLRQVGAAPVGGTPLFRLVTHPAAASLFRALAESGILTRPFDFEPSWLRFGYPGPEDDWARLEAALMRFG